MEKTKEEIREEKNLTKTVLIPIAEGSEEIETISVVDALRRAGADVTLASITKQREVTLSRKVKIIADALLSDCLKSDYDLIVLPGGMPGAEHLRDCAPLIKKLKEQKEAGRWIGAICASPVVVLHHHGLLGSLNATAYPSLTNQLSNRDASEFSVVVDKNIVTSQGPGTALLFAIKLIEVLYNKDRAKQISQNLLAEV